MEKITTIEGKSPTKKLTNKDTYSKYLILVNNLVENIT